ncbi:MAG: Eco57I restriction-modification methylase domain-containing protein, partial [Prevotella sp.]|nr:Eco57I restriction-modification methylase domain-containing protein [Prevotella sp.]
MQQDKEVFIRQAYEGRYASMMIFAVDISTGHTLTRSEMAILTRGFNRIASAQPVILFIKQGKRLALATCERSEYTQQWRDGEKLGKVSILRDINCLDPHRGHLDILNSIGSKACSTFEELYKHWMQVFSNELLTKKFYGELSDWYAWAVQVVRFPNDLATKDDDEKFNHESCIRLITRLIFVWFLKQKHLIPEEFFDERYIKEHFIEEFNPHDRENLMYNPEKSRYYRLILQNLFFAMLNRPIVPEGKNIADNRRFRAKGSYHGMNQDYAVNNLMRYESEFMHGGAEEFMEMANSHVPFLNGGLFDCLDDKSNNLYYDGFSERMESLEQLYLPDWLFFGDEVGRSIDLSEWYGDTKKKKVSAQGIIDILKRYNFTIEENTPLDQEVSLDPELLGKAFENLLASYNPETKTSARKQTGSFYTPREIVQYMVDESLVAHLKRTCGEELEAEYRSLLSYATEETTLNEEQRRQVMQALYHCRVLDPACGSGAFPMGILQQMVHILRQLDPTNEMWKEFMRDIAVEQSRKAYSSDEKEERKARLKDIDEAFDKSINDPDYARKLYLIEHCIFGVDIQPIAVQISKLRFFISLVVDQKPTNDAVHNFGIRPLPNLESKFVAANTLIPVDYDASLFESTDAIIAKKEQLKELNHQIFLAKRNIDKQRLKAKIKETRKALAKAIENTGFVNPGAAQQLADWDMFEQNTSSPFFDAEWMFGVKGGFDIVIGNPPYVFARNSKEKGITQRLKKFYKQHYKLAKYQVNLYHLFVEKGANLLKPNGIFAYIIPNNWLT